MIGYIKGKAGDAGAGKWNVTSLPGGAGGNWGGSYLGIPASSPHKEEAAKLIAWLTAPEQQAKVFAQVGNFPSTTAGDHRGRRRHRPVLQRRPDRPDLLRRRRRPRPCRSSDRRTAS